MPSSLLLRCKFILLPCILYTNVTTSVKYIVVMTILNTICSIYAKDIDKDSTLLYNIL